MTDSDTDYLEIDAEDVLAVAVNGDVVYGEQNGDEPTEYATVEELEAVEDFLLGEIGVAEDSLQGQLDTLGDDHDILQAQVDDLDAYVEDEFAQLDDYLSALSDDVDGLETAVEVIEGDIAELQQTTDDQGGELSAHDARLEALESAVDDVQSTLASLDDRVADLEAEIGLWDGHELVVGDDEPETDSYIHFHLNGGGEVESADLDYEAVRESDAE